MAWTNAPQQGMQASQEGAPEKKNFRIGRIYAADSKVEVGMCTTQKGGFYITLSITSGVKNPATNQISYENTPPMERPSMLLNATQAAAILRAITNKDGSVKAPSEIGGTLILDMPAVDSKLTLTPSGNNITMTLDSQKRGTRTSAFIPTNLGFAEINGNWEVFVKYLKIGYAKLITNKLDPEEFKMAVASVSDEGSDDMPF